MRFSRRATFVIMLTFIVAILIPVGGFAAAQDAADPLEQAALAVHLQNQRARSFTAWIGGPLGDAEQSPAITVLGETLDRWTFSGQAGDDDLAFDDLTRPTLLNFWASWCYPCQLEFPHMVETALAPDMHAFDVVLVNIWDEPDEARAYLDQYPAALRTVRDDDDKFARRARIASIPTSMLLDTDGTVLAVHTGLLTPTLVAFLDHVAAQPGAGSFVAADYAEVEPHVILDPVAVDEAEPVAFATPVYGTITADDPQDAYRFEGQAGDEITIHQTAAGSELDSTVVLLDADGTIIAENDDINPGIIQDSRLEVTLPANGMYMVVATRFLEAEGFSEGRYELRVDNTTWAAGEVAEPSGSVGEVAAPDAAQPGGDVTLAYGETVTGTLSNQTYEEAWTFYGTAGDAISVAMTRAEDVAGGLDGYLILRGPDNEILLEVDDANDSIMPVIEDYVLPETGVYTLVATRFGGASGFSVGEYALALQGPATITPPPDAAPPGAATDLSYGASVSGTISDADHEQAWTFYGTAGDVISATMTRAEDVAGGLDGYLILRGPDNEILLEVDDANDSIMPAIEGYTLPETGVYTLVATRFGFANGFSRGEYTLALRSTSGAAAAPGPSAAGSTGAVVRWFDPGTLPDDLRWIGYNGPVEGTLDRNNVDDWYIFNGTAGDELAIMMTPGPGDLDPLVMLVDENGVELARNDDSAPGALTARIASFTLPADGSYLVRATRYGLDHGPSQGEYTLVIETEASSPVVDDSGLDPVDLPLGTTVSGGLDLDHTRARYIFQAAAGETFTVTVTRITGDLDPALALYDADGTQLATNRQWQSDGDARLSRFGLPASGTYHLDVRLDNLSTAGEYALFAVLSAPRDPDAGAFVPAVGQDLEIVLIWNAAADLDLTVSGPAEPTTDAAHANDFCTETVPAPVEQLTWAEGRAAPGDYTVSISYRLDCTGSAPPVDFIVVIVQRGEVVDLIAGRLARAGDRYVTPVTVGP